MKFVGYGRVSPGADEIPLSTQKHACQRFCEQNKHAFVRWWEDECEGTKQLLDRENFPEVVRHVANNEIDGILVWDHKKLSTDPAISAGVKPLFQMAINEEIEVYTPEGPVDFTESPEQETEMVGDAMKTLSATVGKWQTQVNKFRIREAAQEKLEKGEMEAISKPPFGIETDKQRFENRDEVYEYYPDDREEDNFKTAIKILNEFGHNDTSPWDTGVDPTLTAIAKKYDVSRYIVKSVWKNQETHRRVAEEHRPELTILF